MRAAIIHAGMVENVIIVGIGFDPGVGRALIELAEDSPVGPGWTYDGQDFTPPQIVEPVPEAVTARQARLALLGAGLLSTVEQALSGMAGLQGDAARIEWEYALEIRRDSPLIGAIAPMLNLTTQQVDDLFRAAEGL
jgi:hypothetical protein